MKNKCLLYNLCHLFWDLPADAQSDESLSSIGSRMVDRKEAELV